MDRNEIIDRWISYIQEAPSIGYSIGTNCALAIIVRNDPNIKIPAPAFTETWSYTNALLRAYPHFSSQNINGLVNVNDDSRSAGSQKQQERILEHLNTLR